MVCGCSWSMKIAERSSATDQLPQLVEDQPAQLVARHTVRGGAGGRRRRLRARAPRLEAREVAERLGRGVGQPRPLQQVPWLQVLREARAAEEPGADGHRRG